MLWFILLGLNYDEVYLLLSPTFPFTNQFVPSQINSILSAIFIPFISTSKLLIREFDPEPSTFVFTYINAVELWLELTLLILTLFWLFVELTVTNLKLSPKSGGGRFNIHVSSKFEWLKNTIEPECSGDKVYVVDVAEVAIGNTVFMRSPWKCLKCLIWPTFLLI